MALNIKIDNFEGPFDLLLHLIKKNKMDIYNIRIHEITNQYLQYLNEMKEMDLEITSEFIVIAATLLEIKSKLLLPSTAKDETAADVEGDAKDELITRLIEYKKFKQAAQYLRDKERDYGVVFMKKPEIIEEVKNETEDRELLKGITMLQLYNIFNELMNRYNSKINKENVISREIPIDIYKIEDKIAYLRGRIDSQKHMSFSSLAKKCSHKMEIVVTFLALLELIKLKDVRVIQEKNFTEIYLERIENNEKSVL